MSTSTYYNFIGSPAGEHNKRPLRSQQDMKQIDQSRQAAISPAASFATSSSNSSSSLNSQFNSLTPNSAASSSTTYSSTSSSSSASSTASTTNLFNSTILNRAIPAATVASTTPRSLASFNRDIFRQTSMTPTQNHLPHNDQHHSVSQLTHSYTLHSLEPKPLKPFKSRSAYIDAMKEDLAEWLNSIYSDLELTPDGFFSQLETGAIICRHANNVTQMGRNLMIEQTAAANLDNLGGSDNENGSSINDSSITSQHNTQSSPSPDQDDNHHGQLTSLNFVASNQFNQRHRNSTTNSSISSISTTTSSSTGRHRFSLTGGSAAMCTSRSSDKNIDWFRVKVIPYKTDAKPGTFFARDNICQFILWCRSLNILECLLFETDDLVARKNEKSFILCLLEVARIGFKVGMPTPLIIQLEQEIDREIEEEAKLEAERVAIAAAKKNEDNNLRDGRATNGVSNDNDKNNNSYEDGSNDANEPAAKAMQQRPVAESQDLAAAVVAEAELEKDCENGDSEKAASTKTAQKGEEDEFSLEDFGPKPQVITNDLLSLHEKVVQLLCQCTCPKQFPMERIGDGKYKVGDKLIIFVRILRRHIMVRVGGGWQELSEFLRQKDPCRAKQNQITIPSQQQLTGSRHLNTSSNGGVAISSPIATSPVTPTSGTTNMCSIPVYRSRISGSSHHLNSKVSRNHKSPNVGNGNRLISGSASMSWLSHN